MSLTQQSTETDFLTDFAALSRFGATPAGGVDREALTEADAAQRRWLQAWLEERGFTTSYDRVGNQYGTVTWDPDAPYVLVGSHLDSQPRGGRYDGAYGVLAAAHAAWRLVRGRGRDGGKPRYNVAVVNWFNEEGSRFQPSMMGSSVYTGKMAAEDALSTTDSSGTSVREALRSGGFDGDGDGPRAAAYAEIHIEQGRVLEDSGTRIGLVHATWAADKMRFVVHGEQSHTGSTVMADRRDALLGAARLVVAAREVADAFTPDLHTSVGQLDVLPNSPVVVAREVRLHLDMRSADEEVLDRARALLAERVARIEEETGVAIERVTAHAWGLQSYDPRGVELADEVATGLGLSRRRIMTIAGHDSTNMKDLVPSVMLFVPSVAGISHNEGEATSDEDVCAGVDLLTGTLERLVDGTLDEDAPG